jgi:hypothetical protein
MVMTTGIRTDLSMIITKGFRITKDMCIRTITVTIRLSLRTVPTEKITDAKHAPLYRDPVSAKRLFYFKL